MVIPRVRSLTVVATGLVLATVLCLGVLSAQAPPAFAGGAAPCYGTGTFPDFPGTPPWGFRTGATPSPSAASASFARAYGDINLSTGRISGHICQVNIRHGVKQQIIIAPVSPITYHTHTAEMWGHAGNEIKTRIVVRSSTDLSCTVGTRGLMTMYASYDNVRSDSIQFRFAKGCTGHDHLYHGAQVNAQVPPL